MGEWISFCAEREMRVDIAYADGLSLSLSLFSYEGTGRSLSLKLVEQLREESKAATASGRVLREIELEEPIRYGRNDPVEKFVRVVVTIFRP